jgi:DNA-binding winged helix-turn-helix (wHTH) protein/tetratricopeptide (TPR) repeat protein
VIYRFGPYELDEAGRELRRNGEQVETEPKAFDLLLYLLQNRDRAVSKDELQTRLWPRSIVTEASLTRCVMKARRAIGDDASRQSVISTLHSHGYRFVATIDETAEQAASSPLEEFSQTLTMAAQRIRKPRSKHYLFAGTVLLMLTVGVGLLTLRDPAPHLTSGVVAVLPVDNRVDDEDLDWVRVGLMGLLTRMLEDAGIDVAPERVVLRIASDTEVGEPPGDDWLSRIRLEAGADVLLDTTLDLTGGLYRLAAIVTYGDGRRTRRVIVGDSPAELAADMARVIAGIVSGDGIETAGRFAKVSADPFVNELYARGLDLELQGRYDNARAQFQVAASEEPELFFLRYEIALCARELREWDSAEMQFQALYEEAQAGDDPRALIATLTSRGIMALNRNDTDAAEPQFREALEVASGKRFVDERATVHTNLALVASRRGDTALAKQHFDQALESFEEADKEPSPSFDNNYAGLLVDLGDFATAQQYAERAVEGFRVRGERQFEAPSLNRLAKILRHRGDIEGGILLHQQAMLIYQEIGDALGEISVMTAMTAAYREKGDLTRARLNADETRMRADSLGDDLARADAFMQSAHVDSDSGLHEAALANFESALGIFEKLGDPVAVREANSSIALESLALGDTAEALSIAQISLEAAIAAEKPADQARASWLLGRITQAGGDVTSGATQYTAALDFARDNANQSLLVDSAMSLAQLHLETGDVDAAEELIDEIRDVAATQRDFMRIDARLALARNDRAKALAIMSKLRTLAGEAWQPADEALIRELEKTGS